MSAVVIRLADYRKPLRQGLRREPDAMSLLLDTYEFLGLCNIAVFYALVCACRIAREAHHAR